MIIQWIEQVGRMMLGKERGLRPERVGILKIQFTTVLVFDGVLLGVRLFGFEGYERSGQVQYLNSMLK